MSLASQIMSLEDPQSRQSALQAYLSQSCLSLNVPYNPDLPPATKQKLAVFLGVLVEYPSRHFAAVHARANRIGEGDYQLQGQASLLRDAADGDVCVCCGLREQKEQLGLGVGIEEVRNMGSSTYLFFRAMINLSLLSFTIFAVYSIYALCTNIKAYTSLPAADDQTALNRILLISFASQHQLQATNKLTTQSVMLLLSMIACFLIIFIIKVSELRLETRLDLQSVTAADFAVEVEGVHFGALADAMICSGKGIDYAGIKVDFQTQMQMHRIEVIEGSKEVEQCEKLPIKIADICFALPFEEVNEQEAFPQLAEQKKQLKAAAKDYIKNSSKQGSVSIEQMLNQVQKYQDFMTNFGQSIETRQIFQQYLNNVLYLWKTNPNYPLYITFQNSYNKLFFIKHANNKCNWNFCEGGSTNLAYKYSRFDDDVGVDQPKPQLPEPNRGSLKILDAPEPEDIFWKNFGYSRTEKSKKILLTFGCTIVALVISFFLVYFVSVLQYQANQHSDKNSSKYFSYITSLIILLMNKAIETIIHKLTAYQMHTSYTQQQTSFAIKTIIATEINSIVLPVAMSVIIKQDMYENGGLAEDVFYIALNNAFLTPVMKVLDPGYLLSWVMKKYYYSKAETIIGMTQKQFNSLQEPVTSELGSKYIYPADTFIFACAFAPLQPIVFVLAGIGLVLMYFAQKYCLYRRESRPKPGKQVINDFIWRVICAGPLLMAISNLVIVVRHGAGGAAIAANVGALGLGVLILVVPYKGLAQKWEWVQIGPNMKYSEYRLSLPHTFDRSNPYTRFRSIKQFKQAKNIGSKKSQASIKSAVSFFYYIQQQIALLFG